jgi:hypothetical protein
MKLFNDIHEGQYRYLVTMKEVAAYAHRIIRLRDGMIEATFQNSFQLFLVSYLGQTTFFFKFRTKKDFHHYCTRTFLSKIEFNHYTL